MHSLAVLLGAHALVLKEFNINQEGEEYVHITARKAGLISWLLTLLGIDTTTVFRVFADRIEFQTGSLSGKLQDIIPLRSISIATCGYMKPFGLLFMAAIFFILGFLCVIAGLVGGSIAGAIGGVFLWGVLGLVCIIFYVLNKSCLISVIPHCGHPIAIGFKRSIIEGVKIEYAQAQAVIQIINQLIIYQTSK